MNNLQVILALEGLLADRTDVLAFITVGQFVLGYCTRVAEYLEGQVKSIRQLQLICQDFRYFDMSQNLSRLAQI